MPIVSVLLEREHYIVTFADGTDRVIASREEEAVVSDERGVHAAAMLRPASGDDALDHEIEAWLEAHPDGPVEEP